MTHKLIGNQRRNELNRIGQKWSQDDVAILKARIASQTGVPAIANELGRCEKGVRSKAYSLGLKFGKPRE